MTMETTDGKKQRIVIVGAGPAGLSTALNLTDETINPGWRDRYEVDVYQMGWRAGGKGATGRNEEACDRIEEHGIHLFGNFYFNAVGMLEKVIDEIDWDEHDIERTMDELLIPSTASSATDYFEGRWLSTVTPIMGDGKPPAWEDRKAPDPDDVVGSLLAHSLRILSRALRVERPGRGMGHFVETVGSRWLGLGIRWYRRRILRKIDAEKDNPRAPDLTWHQPLVDHMSACVRSIGWVERWFPRPMVRAYYIELDLLTTLFRGLLNDKVVEKGIESIDDVNYDVWLRNNGASKTTMDSGFPQAIPNTALGYARGDTTLLPTMSAAAFVMFFTRWLLGTGPGAYFFCKGTGDTVIKPMYRLLEQRGVRFHFFHKLATVEPEPGEDRVARLVFDVQAHVREGNYQPLRRLDTGELVWPNRPLWDQLVEGDQLKQGDELHAGGYDLESWWTAWQPVEQLTLTAGADFDEVVLATPIGTLEHTCPALIARSADWQHMVANIKSAATQATQLWLDKTTRELGWDGPLIDTDRYLGGIYGQDLTSYCDFSDLIRQERWPEGSRPKGLIYLIGALPDPDVIPPFDDHDYPARQDARVHWSTVQFLRNIDGLLPRAVNPAVDPRSLDFERLVAHDGTTMSQGVNRFEQQYWRANIDPNERYTLSVPGSGKHRLDAWDSKFDNLVLAGDWIHTGWDVGSFEAAVMSGKLASLTLTGAPKLEDIWGYTFLQLPRPAPPPPRIPSVL